MVHYRVSPATASHQAGLDDHLMTPQRFREWIKSIDQNGDGRISWKELRDALRVLGMGCTRWNAWRALVHADLNHNNHIDGELEVDELMKYAAKRWGITGA